MHESEKWKWSRSVVSNSSRPHGLQPTRLLCPWDFPGKNTGVECRRGLHIFLGHYMLTDIRMLLHYAGIWSCSLIIFLLMKALQCSHYYSPFVIEGLSSCCLLSGFAESGTPLASLCPLDLWYNVGITCNWILYEQYPVLPFRRFFWIWIYLLLYGFG